MLGKTIGMESLGEFTTVRDSEFQWGATLVGTQRHLGKLLAVFLLRHAPFTEIQVERRLLLVCFGLLYSFRQVRELRHLLVSLDGQQITRAISLPHLANQPNDSLVFEFQRSLLN